LENKNKKVVITGLGALTPLGIGVEKYWQNLIIDPLDFMDKQEARKNDRFTQFILAASEEAVKNSGLNFDTIDPFRAGVIIGSGIGGLGTLLDQHNVILSKGPRRVSPYLIPNMIVNMASGVVSIRYKLNGPNMCVVSACASANHSIGEAYKYIERGDVDIMLCGGAEAPIVALGVAGFINMKAVSARNDEPEKASRPFDRDRDGFVIGEGAAVLVLESEEHALSRGAKIYAHLAGYGVSADAFHIAAPEPSGIGAQKCMENALKDAGFAIDEIDYVNAHGTSTPIGDKSEVNAIKNLFKDHAHKLKISSNKSMIGHLLGAAGGAETIATVLTVERGFIPPTINLDNPDFDLDFVPHKGVESDVHTAINNSFGFGGHNASLVITRYAEK
jgi:3-oxoacyl-[acyl-carrier-protein] synthase II